MKLIKNICAIALALCLALPCAYAQRSKTSNADIKSRLSEGITKSDNGDFFIEIKLRAAKAAVESAKDIPSPLLMLLLYVDPKMDFDKFNKIMVKETGGKETRYVADILNAADKYLATNNMQLKKIKFSANNARLKIDQGLPLFISLHESSDFGKILARSELRKQNEDIKEWKKSLAKTQLKTLSASKNYITFGLLVGYNKITSEFAILLDGKPHWFTEAELKKVVSDCHELRL
ncbi:MAG: hypothetical protein IKO42_06355 [Opitutales bacterium]|nr:hypothetical protein [Opitutales bacterium]